jgi:hypothetical protein
MRDSTYILKLAEYLDTLDDGKCKEAAADIRKLNDLLGKANALCRYRLSHIKFLEDNINKLLNKL